MSYSSLISRGRIAWLAALGMLAPFHPAVRAADTVRPLASFSFVDDVSELGWFNAAALGGTNTLRLKLSPVTATGEALAPTDLDTTRVPTVASFTARGFVVSTVSSSWQDAATDPHVIVTLFATTDATGDTSSLSAVSLVANDNAFVDRAGNGSRSTATDDTYSNGLGAISFVGLDRAAPSATVSYTPPYAGTTLPLKISVTFSDAVSGVNSDTISADNFFLTLGSDSTTPVATVTVASDAVDSRIKVYTYTPTTAWALGTTYTLRVNSDETKRVYDSAVSTPFQPRTANPMAAGALILDGTAVTFTPTTLRPIVTDARIAISGASGAGGVYRTGDTVTATWNNTASGDNNVFSMSSVTVDFRQFGSGAAVDATNNAGIWTASYPITAGTIEATGRNVSVTATDSFSSSTTTTADTTNATVDNRAPSAPSAPVLAASLDTGVSISDGFTKTNALYFTGTAEAGSVVTVRRGGVGALGTVTANDAGDWLFNYTGTPLADGSYAFSATAADAVGNVSAASIDLSVTIEKTPPTLNVSAPSTSVTVRGPISYTVTYADANFSASTLAPGDITLNRTGTLDGSLAVTGTGMTRTVTISNITGVGTLGISIAAGTATDLAGNLAPASGASATFTVAKTTPVISWGTPASITYGTSLGAAQLNATANVAGSFAYTPAAGTTLDAGNQTLRAAFTPFDSASYNSVPVTTVTLVVAKAAQTIAFAAPAGTPALGTPVALSATASSGLPVTFALVSGPATLSGSSLTFTSSGLAVVRAAQAGNDNFLPASSVELTLASAARAAQTIAFAPLGTKLTSDAAFTVSASASSGLPVTLTLLNGPAALSGNTVTLTGAAGVVAIRASQAGNGAYLPAPEVTQSFEVLGRDVQQVFFGRTENNDNFAVAVAPDGKSGTLVCFIDATGEAIIVEFNVLPDGTFTAMVVTQSNPFPESRAVGGLSIASRAAAPVTRTISGRLLNGVLTGAIAELGLRFSAAVQPSSGPTAAVSGLYRASTTNTSSGSAYTVVGTQGQVFALAVTPTATTAGLGTISAGNAFVVEGAGSTTIRGSIDQSAASVSGTISTAGRPDQTFAGASATVVRTDRLANLSSRVRIAPTDGRSLITGFVIGGTQSKRVLLRGIGPALTAFGVSGALVNPRLQLFDATGNIVAENDDWSGVDLAAAFGQTGAFALSVGTKDAALIATLAPGAYTMQITAGAEAGAGLAEIYDAGATLGTEPQRLVNISTRGAVEVGPDGLLIGGFFVSGNTAKRVLIRGIGPSLGAFGVTGALADPRLAVFSGATMIAQNDNWSTPAPLTAQQTAATAVEISAAAQLTGAFALTAGSRDAAVILTLAPGAYTAQVGSADGTSAGVALVEIYEMP